MALCLHCGSIEVNEDAVRQVKTPEATATWTPVPHSMVLDRVKSEINSMGMRVVAQSFGLWNSGARFFGLLEVQNGHNHEDFGLVVGVRNSHDQSFSLSLGMGSHVFVCDNLSFSSSVVVMARHSKKVMERIPTLITRATGKLIEQRHLQDERIDRYKKFEMNDLYAHDMMCRAVRDHVIAPSAVAKVMSEWYQPRYSDFEPRTVWSLFNAFTETLKQVNPLDMPKRTMLLHGLCDGYVGLAVNN